ncbi:protein trafficking Pga2 [Xylariales sp. PMI_506]|nr:protein trafficking Pga2 [Xylariales sp. PMI_506]
MAELGNLVSHLGESIEKLFGFISVFFERFIVNTSASFTTMSAKQWIRLVMIVGTYCLVRPYVLKHAAKVQETRMEKESQEGDAQAQISPNDLRGSSAIHNDTDEEEEENATAATTASDWGKKARKRQRVVLKKLIDAEEKRLEDLQADEEDKDIQQYLMD